MVKEERKQSLMNVNGRKAELNYCAIFMVKCALQILKSQNINISKI